MEDKEVKPRFKKGFWKPEEDLILKKYVETHGEGNWTVVSKKSGLLRGAKSCRLRWKNYLRPNIKRGVMSEDEKDLIIRLHKLLGNRWSLIAGRLPGRTDNEVKNYWNTHLNKRPSKDQITHLDSKSEEKRQLSLSSHTVQEKNLQTIMATSAKEGEIDTSIDSWVENLKNVDYGMNMPPLPPDYSPFFHNYEAFMPILDNLVLLEPFGSSAGDIMRETIFL
ncbi:hypothetical protein Pfo_031301 [Paulownia fortunei]|nr:hypothetical protein Pfo_003558 [Paulownia fortunei]KAI3446894.1 hypothetical protein Pfo_003559 [Paulownia fortunei]KAI3473054.1 hypothetical protein Pfo_031301 [Paulownia fortunei]